jgi:hypothetical protein
LTSPWNGGMCQRGHPRWRSLMSRGSSIPIGDRASHQNDAFVPISTQVYCFRYPAFYRMDFRFRMAYTRTDVLLAQSRVRRSSVPRTLPTEYPVRTDSASLAGVAGPSFVRGRESRINEEWTGETVLAHRNHGSKLVARERVCYNVEA